MLETDLFDACIGNDFDRVVMMLELYDDLDIDFQHGRHQYMTPLMVASREGHYEVACVLLEHGADADLVSADGYTALALSVEFPAIVLLLLNYGANPNPERAVPPICVAAAAGCNTSIDILLRFGACISVCDLHGETPLGLARSNGNFDLVEVFIDSGAV